MILYDIVSFVENDRIKMSNEEFVCNKHYGIQGRFLQHVSSIDYFPLIYYSK